MPEQYQIEISPACGDRLQLFEALARYRSLILVLYWDDAADEVSVFCESRYELRLPTKKVGSILGNVEVHTFGLDDFPPGTVIELCVVAADASAEVDSVKQLSAIKVRLFQTAQQAI